MSSLLQQATDLIQSDPRQAEEQLIAILDSTPADEDEQHDQEDALLTLGKLYRDEKNSDALASIIKKSRSQMSTAAKAKTAKLIRTLIDFFSDIPNAQNAQIDCTKDTIEWARSEKRVFLRQSLETKLAGLQIEFKSYREALTLIEALLKEVKRLDDKLILTEIHLLESRASSATANWAKAKAALTAARTAANSIYCPPLLQAQLDMQSGILHAEDKDYKTAYSYFFETFEGYSAADDDRALKALKYMLLCKIMLNLPQDVTSLIQTKLALKYSGKEVEAMKAIAQAHQNRSLGEFERALKEWKDELSNDPIIRSHLAALYDTLLEQNLVRIIEPYSRVQIAHVADQVGQPVQAVETKLSQMILDKVFFGVLDQGAGALLIFDEPKEDGTYTATLETMKHVGDVVESLYEKATKLS
ncbi:pci-domain-containing protein [Phaffia rhodozyma]|uniref:Pci-domain-containing protein n=1 Tax=Phaffia rhodozyma TaxID=264483 RepID=A0A0F7SJ30_PHARH|nr:pci-domain-containing protein [Phaffia rhodozyma]